MYDTYCYACEDHRITTRRASEIPLTKQTRLQNFRTWHDAGLCSFSPALGWFSTNCLASRYTKLWHKTFLTWDPTPEPQPRHSLWLQKCLRPRWHSLSKGCLRHQTIKEDLRRVGFSRMTRTLGFLAPLSGDLDRRTEADEPNYADKHAQQVWFTTAKFSKSDLYVWSTQSLLLMDHRKDWTKILLDFVFLEPLQKILPEPPVKCVTIKLNSF